MAYTTNQLITGAYYASGIVSREFEEVSGPEIGDGLIWLNEVLAEKTVDQGLIPYETTYNFTGVIGQEDYVIADLISIDTLTFTLDSVRYSMSQLKRNEYFGSSRTNSITSLPFQYYFERGLGGGTLSLYFEPSQAYAFELMGVFRLAEVALNQDLTLTLDTFYTTYLRYALAAKICVEYNEDIPRNISRELGKYQALIDKSSRELDMMIHKVSTLQRNTSLNYAAVNIGRGWTTSG